MMTRWEYRTEKDPGEVKLAELGKYGWELVAVVVQFTTHFCYFKRRREA